VRFLQVFGVLVPDLTGEEPLLPPRPDGVDAFRETHGGHRYWVLLCEADRRFELLTHLLLRPVARHAFWVPVNVVGGQPDLRGAWHQRTHVLEAARRRVGP